MERLAALVPRPRVHLTRFHGILAPNYKFRKDIVPKPSEPQTVTTTCDTQPTSKNIPWARLLARVFKIDVETCPHCGGHVRIIAAIEDPTVIKKILTHLGLPTKPPRLHPARGPPVQNHHDFGFEQDNSANFDLSFDSFNTFTD